tara:strand:+ start:183 stop:539 length:357 start_codon:yes stop_codon:yes gene_type:complete
MRPSLAEHLHQENPGLRTALGIRKKRRRNPFVHQTPRLLRLERSEKPAEQLNGTENARLRAGISKSSDRRATRSGQFNGKREKDQGWRINGWTTPGWIIPEITPVWTTTEWISEWTIE